MYLKDAFRYQNYLQGLIDKTLRYLMDESVVMKTTQVHMRKKANPDAEDETIDMTADRPVSHDANTLVDFLQYLITEKEKLTGEISETKSAAAIDIDCAVANNKNRQRFVSILSEMANLKSKERMKRGTDYKFNAEGNQVTYNYDVKEISVIDFDRSTVKAIMRRLSKESDEASANVDRMLVECKVDYEPQFDVNDSYEDALEQFQSLNVKQ